MSPQPTRTDPPLVGALWMWFAAIGGAVAWAVHLFVAWGVTETACLAGHSAIAGFPVKAVVAAATVIPLLVCLSSLGAAWWMRHQTSPHRLDGDTERGGRARLLSGVGLWANLLFTAVIVFDGVALLVFPTCQM
jgi:hypothetical protein